MEVISVKKGIVLFTAIVSLSVLLAGCSGTANTVSDTVKEGKDGYDHV